MTAAGGGGFHAPAQRVEDFLCGRPSRAWGEVVPTVRPAATPADLMQVLPPDMTAALKAALPALDRRLHGFAAPDAVLTALEEGASVCCLQKEPAVSANGAGASCVAHKYSDPGPPSAADPQPVLRRPRVFGHAASVA